MMSRVVQPHERLELLSAEFAQPTAEAEIAGVIRNHLGALNVAGQRGVEVSPLGETLFLDSRIALVDNMLLYFDKTSMAASLEVRVPSWITMSSRTAWGCRTPGASGTGVRRSCSSARVRAWSTSESSTRRSVASSIPALGAWLRVHKDALVTDILLDERMRSRGQIRPDAVAEIVRTAGEGGKKPAQRLFSLLLLEKWQRMWVDSDGPGASLRPQNRQRAHAA